MPPQMMVKMMKSRNAGLISFIVLFSFVYFPYSPLPTSPRWGEEFYSLPRRGRVGEGEMGSLLHHHPDNHIDYLDSDKRGDDTPNPIDQQVMDQQFLGRHRTEFGSLQSQRHQHRNDDGVEDDRRQDGGKGAGQVHHVEYAQLRVDREQRGRDDSKVLGDIVGDAEGGQV